MMRSLNQTGQLSAWLLLCGICLTSQATAQEQQSASAGTARPQALETEVGLSPEMLKILQTWEEKSSDIKRSKGEFTRIIYDAVFRSASCAVGKYYYEGPDKGRMDFNPNEAIIKEPAPTVKKFHAGEGKEITYTCKPDEAKTWICNGKEILDIDIVKKEYNRIEIPAQFQGQNISDGPLPFLFGMKAKKMEQRYMLQLGSLHDPEKIIHIIAYPKMAAEQREYRVAEVLLDPVTYLPKAVQLLDTTGNKQTVYVFTDHSKVSIPWLPGTTPWNPPMLYFKEILNQQAEAPLERDAKGPAISTGIMLR